MIHTSLRLLTLLALGSASATALADECTTSMLTTSKAVFSSVSTKTDAQGKHSQSRMTQMQSMQYVQTGDGQWHSIAMTLKELVDTTNDLVKTAKITCHREGSDSVNGVATTVYAAHVENEGSISDSRVWIASNHLLMRADLNIEDVKYSTLYDYTRVSAPANAKPIGSR